MLSENVVNFQNFVVIKHFFTKSTKLGFVEKNYFLVIFKNLRKKAIETHLPVSGKVNAW